MTDNKNKDYRGSIWAKDGYFTGIINDEPVVLFKNKEKKQENSPDFFVFRKKTKEELEKEKNSESKQDKMQQIDNILNEQPKQEDTPPFMDEDIPF